MAHCTLLQAGDIQAIVGDDSRNGINGPQYCGVWSLTSRHRPFNAFGNSYAGLIPGEIRGKSPVLEIVDDRACVLARSANEAYPVEVRAEYRVAEPCHIDHVLSFVDRKDVRPKGCSFREVSWCCYTNSPEDPRLHYLSRGEWHRYMSSSHGVAANIAPSYLPAGELEDWPVKGDWRERQAKKCPFHWDRYERPFDAPFYYGRLGTMALILVFDQPRWLRFFCSPVGGGPSLIPGKSCPAWDFEWVIPAAEYSVGKKYVLRMHMIYKPFVSEDDVLDAYRKAQAELGFERKPQ